MESFLLENLTKEQMESIVKGIFPSTFKITASGLGGVNTKDIKIISHKEYVRSDGKYSCDVQVDLSRVKMKSIISQMKRGRTGKYSMHTL